MSVCVRFSHSPPGGWRWFHHVPREGNTLDACRNGQVLCINTTLFGGAPGWFPSSMTPRKRGNQREHNQTIIDRGIISDLRRRRTSRGKEPASSSGRPMSGGQISVSFHQGLAPNVVCWHFFSSPLGTRLLFLSSSP